MCPPKGVPNVLTILLDDVDCSATSALGEPRHRNRDVDIPPSPEEAEQKNERLRQELDSCGAGLQAGIAAVIPGLAMKEQQT